MAITKVTRTLLSTGIVDNSNATAITIDSSENVGIGTSSPATGLEVATTNYTFAGTNFDIYGLFGDTSGGIRLGADSSNEDSVIGTTGTNNLQFVTYNGSAWGSRMTLTNTGNVGIGTTSPLTQLHISGTANNTYIRIDDGSEFTNIGVDATGSFYNTNTNHRFLTASGGTEALRITDTGNVGIGTTSPGTQLTLNKNDNNFLQIRSSDTGNAGIYFGRQNDSVRGAIVYDNSNESFRKFYFSSSYGLPYLYGVGINYINKKNYLSLDLNSSYIYLNKLSFCYNYKLYDKIYIGLNTGLLYFNTKQKIDFGIKLSHLDDLSEKKRNKKRLISCGLNIASDDTFDSNSFIYIPTVSISYLF